MIPATRTCFYMRTSVRYTRNDRYDNSYRRTHTLSAREKSTREEYPVRSRLNDGPTFRRRILPRDFPLANFPARPRERRRLLLMRGSASLKSSIYLSRSLSPRDLSSCSTSSTLFVSLSVYLSISLVFFSFCLSSLFFFLCSPYLSLPPGSLSGLSLPFGRLVSRARRYIG